MRTARPTERSRRPIVGLILLGLVAGCGVPTGPDSFEAISDSEVPNRLADTTTTSTTTTTTTTTTLPDAPQTTTVTSAAPATQLVDVFFVSRGQLRAVEVPAPSPVADTELITLLEDGPTGPTGDVLTSFVEEGLILDTTSERGILTIDLDEDVLNDIRSSDQREAIAQIVLTLLFGIPGVGQAVFTLNGGTENIAVPTGNGIFTERPVSVDDYATMRVDASARRESPTDDLTPISPPDGTSPTAPTDASPDG